MTAQGGARSLTLSRGTASIASKIMTTGPEDAKTKARCGEGVRANISGRRFGSKDARPEE